MQSVCKMTSKRIRVFNCYIDGETCESLEKRLDIFREKCDWFVGQHKNGDTVPYIRLCFGFSNAKTISAARSAVMKIFPNVRDIQITSKPIETIEDYCEDSKKGNGKLLEHGEVPEFNRRRSDELQNKLREAESAENLDKALEIIKDHNISYFICNKKKLICHFENVFSQPDKSKYDITKFIEPKKMFEKNKTLLFVGPTGIGKTQFALAHFAAPVLIRCQQDWNKFNKNTHDGIVLDDIAFRRWTPERIIHMLETETGVTQDIKYGSVHIPAGTKKIICINSMDVFWPSNIKSYHLEACRRRMIVYEFDKPLFGDAGRSER